MRNTREAAADGGGDSGMRRRVDGSRPLLVVVVDDGMLARTTERTVSGETPRVPVAQPVRDSRDAAAIAPTRGSEGVIMPRAKAEMAPAASIGPTAYRITF